MQVDSHSAVSMMTAPFKIIVVIIIIVIIFMPIGVQDPGLKRKL